MERSDVPEHPAAANCARAPEPDEAPSPISDALPPGEREEPPLDEHLAAFDGDREIFALVAQSFMDEWPAVRDRLDRSLQTRDAEEMRQAAHRIKGSSMHLERATAVELAQKLENGWRDEDWPGSTALVFKLELEVNAVCKRLGAILAGAPDG